MKQKNLDDLTIFQIERKVLIREIFLTGTFFGFIFAYLLFIFDAENFTILASKYNVNINISTESNHSVSVSATVLEELKVIELSDDLKEKVIMVSGNVQGVTGTSELGVVLFRIDSSPGEGVVVKLLKTYNNIFINPNY